LLRGGIDIAERSYIRFRICQRASKIIDITLRRDGKWKVET